jgi:glycosyltransferase involved in cell wall biosynthesis
MRVAFYAPLKPPDHPVVSGDRQFARLFLSALRAADHDVRVVSRFRSFEATGNPARQQLLRRRGDAVTRRLLAGALPRWRPDVWFTYHLYYKAPDWLGPVVCRAHAIPYVVAEASRAPKRANGAWAAGEAAVEAALRQANAVVFLNANDRGCVLPLLRIDARSIELPPFLDAAPFARARARRAENRARLATSLGLPGHEVWMLAVGMFRAGAKQASYELLARALERLPHQPWRLLIAGTGPADHEIKALFAPFDERLCWLGAVSPRELPAIYSACDLFVWPAIDEAVGLAVLEAQASGLPAVVGNSGALSAVVDDGCTGRVVRPGAVPDFAEALAALLANPCQREAMGAAALHKVRTAHGIAAAGAELDRLLCALVPGRRQFS